MPRPRVPDELLSGPFTSEQARAAGLSYSALRSRPWRQVLRHVWAHSELQDTREFRFAAVRLVLPDIATLCGLTAAWLWGVEVRRLDDLDIHASFPKGRRARARGGLVPVQETLRDGDVTLLDSVRLTTPTRTAFDCARWLHGVDRLVVLDAMAHRHLVTVDGLMSYWATQHRMRNQRRGGALLTAIDPGAESPMETRLRWLLRQAGVTTLVTQYEVRDPSTGTRWRLDLADPRAMLGVEYDGAVHWEQRRADDRRRQRLRELGWVVLVYSSSDYFGDRERIVAEVRRHLLARAPSTSSSASSVA